MFCLRPLGRLVEAAEPEQAGLELDITRKDWKNAAIAAHNLSELYLTLGDLAQALKYAQQSVELADRSGEAFQRMVNRTTLAAALHQAGRLSEAEAVFREAEDLQKQKQPQFPLLYPPQGCYYCDLLLNQGNYQEVQIRVRKFIEWRDPADSLQSIAMEQLVLGRAYLLQAQREPTRPFTESIDYLNRAVDGLRQAGTQHILPLGLLARAELHRFTGAFTKAQNDLDEALTIATRGGMRLHETDCHLGYARLYVAMNDTGKAREHFVKAKQMVEEIGYHRRDGEVQELEAMINEQ